MPLPRGYHSLIVPSNSGSISSTSSHLFKLTISPPTPPTEDPGTKPPPPTVFLLHPSQPLSHAARLITTCVPPPPPRVSFRSAPGTPDEIQWSDSTDVGDFVKEAANQKEFSIVLTHDEDASSEKGQNNESEIVVTVPSFHERTKYSRLKLHRLKGELRQMDSLKRECDHEAHRGARRVALTGFGMLVVYWGGVARLTFWDLGWYAYALFLIPMLNYQSIGK